MSWWIWIEGFELRLADVVSTELRPSVLEGGN
jgi:hypothetical protein